MRLAVHLDFYFGVVGGNRNSNMLSYGLLRNVYNILTCLLSGKCPKTFLYIVQFFCILDNSGQTIVHLRTNDSTNSPIDNDIVRGRFVLCWDK